MEYRVENSFFLLLFICCYHGGAMVTKLVFFYLAEVCSGTKYTLPRSIKKTTYYGLMTHSIQLYDR